jgi:hypothetical protein
MASNTLGFSMVLADALESVIEDNLFINSGAGILLSAFGPYGGPASYGPIMNTEVLRNTIQAGDATDIWNVPNTNIAGIGLQDFPGRLFSGVMVRDNIVSSLNTIFSTNGVNGINGVVIEHNQANTSFMLTVPGLLIQDNLEWTPWLRQRKRGTVAVGCWGLYSSKGQARSFAEPAKRT